MNDKMRIGELTKLAGVTPRTVRYYESLGLLQPAEREGNGFHYYNEEALARLNKVEQLKQLGLSLEEIGSVIDFYFTDPTGIQGKQKVIEILKRHLLETQNKIRTLQRFEGELCTNISRLENLVREATNS